MLGRSSMLLAVASAAGLSQGFAKVPHSYSPSGLWAFITSDCSHPKEVPPWICWTYRNSEEHLNSIVRICRTFSDTLRKLSALGASSVNQFQSDFFLMSRMTRDAWTLQRTVLTAATPSLLHHWSWAWFSCFCVFQIFLSESTKLTLEYQGILAHLR